MANIFVQNVMKRLGVFDRDRRLRSDPSPVSKPEAGKDGEEAEPRAPKDREGDGR